MKIKKLKEAPYNPRKISKLMLEKLKQSIQKFGYIEPIIYNKRTGYVVGGNQRLKALRELYGDNYEVKVIELDLNEEQEKTLNIALNKITGTWDFDKLKEIVNKLPKDYFNLTGFKENDFQNIYTKKIEPPIYTPREIKPQLFMLYDKERYEELLKLIENSNVTQTEKEFLKLAATRFITFYFDKIADYYANASKEMQELMEKLALVIIDFNKAIEEGFIELTDSLAEEYFNEYGEE